MQPAIAAKSEERVRISVGELVRLSRYGRAMQMQPGRIHARHGGEYQSPFRGRGMEFDESRLYQPGDDIRNIDWRVTARTGKTHTKLFREERERPVLVWIDFRRSMFFATRGSFKSVIAARCSVLVAWGAVQHGDRIGGVVFSETAHHEIKPRRGKLGALRLIEQVAGHSAWDVQARQDQDARVGSKALARLERVVRPGSLVCLISDFRGLDEMAWSSISRLSRHNDLLMVHVYDRFESRLPAGGMYRIANGSEELVINTHDRGLLERHTQRFRQHQLHLQELANKNRIKLLHCSTEEDPVTVLTATTQAVTKE